METTRSAEAIVAFAECKRLGEEQGEKDISIDELVAECKRRLSEPGTRDDE